MMPFYGSYFDGLDHVLPLSFFFKLPISTFRVLF